MNNFETIMLFGIGINKFKVTNWTEKKPKLLELIGDLVEKKHLQLLLLQESH